MTGTLSLLCIATNLAASAVDRARRHLAPPGEISAIAHLRVGFAWNDRGPDSATIEILHLVLSDDPELRHIRLKDWAEHCDESGPHLLASIGGCAFLPVLRRTYLNEELTPPNFALSARRTKMGFASCAHVDFAEILSGAPDLVSFLHACGCPRALARAAAGPTATGSLLRAIVAFHLALRALQGTGFLSAADRCATEAQALRIMKVFGPEAAALCRTLARPASRS